MKMKVVTICFTCRTKYANQEVNNPDFPETYDFCPLCVGWILRNMERQVLGLPPLPRNYKTHLRVEEK